MIFFRKKKGRGIWNKPASFVKICAMILYQLLQALNQQVKYLFVFDTNIDRNQCAW